MFSLLPGSTDPLFVSEFEGAEFFGSPQVGGGVFAVGQEDTTNIFVFDDTNDVAAGGDEVDILMANGGDDNIMGAEGTDFLFGGFGDDIVRGGEGDDVVVGNEGSDILISGSGSDIYEYFADQILPGDLDIILDFEAGEDAVVIVGSTDVTYDNTTGFLTVDGTTAAVLDAGLGLEVLTRANSAVVFEAGADVSSFGTAPTPEDAEDQPDTLDSEEGSEALSIVDTAPSLAPGSTDPLFISNFEGAQFFDAPQEGGGVFAVGQEDTTNIFVFEDSNDVAAGGDEVDIFMANGGDDNIMGAEGTDFMFGGTGDDIVRGGAGDDVVVGNEGSDVLIGGTGADIFEFFADQFGVGDLDVVLDFEAGSDALVIVGSTDASYDNVTGFVSVDGTEVATLDAGLGLDVLVRGNSAVIS
ncbi:calcium-binding protein [Acaryochloris sp. CCMEE 5410]|uniref:calcium-binding protein n=1 Tax=Acaryochloris sp. CCMEE 5410 TaxID=310037 RepID=UPI0002484FAD|nr:calcium-binding protein [Acaryochloris sp. CCMEE 5410]